MPGLQGLHARRTRREAYDKLTLDSELVSPWLLDPSLSISINSSRLGFGVDEHYLVTCERPLSRCVFILCLAMEA